MSESISNTVVYDVEYDTEIFTSQTITAGSQLGLQITAPTGKYVLAGGGSSPGIAGVAISGSGFGGSGTYPNIWFVDYINLTGSDVTVTVTLYGIFGRIAGL